MGLILLVVAAMAYWAWKTRDRQTLRLADAAGVVAALIGLRLLSRGQELPALLSLGGAGWWYWLRFGRRMPKEPMTAEQASRLLDVPVDASPDTIRAAHRRLVARVHPDVGGSADLTAQVNAARDALLRRRS
jgi:DnaJ homolog subfamily C member 19